MNHPSSHDITSDIYSIMNYTQGVEGRTEQILPIRRWLWPTKQIGLASIGFDRRDVSGA